MTRETNDIPPHDFWQAIAEPDTYEEQPAQGHWTFFPARLPDGRQLVLPIRVRDGGREALASLIVNQASFAVVDALAEALAAMARPFAPDIVVAMPTLGLTLAEQTARRLGHQRYVPLSTSRKFWYEDDLSVPLRSITSPDQAKQLYVDPRMLPLLAGRRVMLIDDVVSTGSSMLAACRLMEKCGIAPSLIGCAMLQTDRWRDTFAGHDPTLVGRVLSVFSTPRLVPVEGGGWRPA